MFVEWPSINIFQERDGGSGGGSSREPRVWTMRFYIFIPFTRQLKKMEHDCGGKHWAGA